MNLCNTKLKSENDSNICFNIEKQLRSKNSDYSPPKASPIIEEYLNTINSRIKTELEKFPIYSKKLPKRISIAINNLTKSKRILIKCADKNLGITIVTRRWYKAEALKQLNDPLTYLKVDKVPSIAYFQSQIVSILHKNNRLHIQNGKFLAYLCQFTNTKKETINSKFYLTIKVHKTPIVGRPIAASIGTPTYYVSTYLDKVLQPIIKKHITSYIKNSNSLILQLLNIDSIVGNDICLLTADVESLYPSINIQDGLEAMKIFLLDYKSLNSAHIDNHDIEFILDCAVFILENNYIEFGNSFWKQIKGTAMGTPFAVTFACIYMHEFEKKLIKNMLLNKVYINNIPLHFFRFIDDIFGIFICTEAAKIFVQLFNEQKPNIIKLKITSLGKSVEMLDLIININSSNKISTNLYQKPQNRYLYFASTSFHQPCVFKAFIQAEIKRYRICCSNDDDFLTATNNFIKRLLTRGYDAKYLNEVINFNVDRTELLKKLAERNNIKESVFIRNKTQEKLTIFKTNYTQRQISIRIKKCLEYTEALHFDKKSKFIFNFNKKTPTLCYKRSKNLKEILTSSKFLESYSTRELKTVLMSSFC
jgi:hypothetical protein